MYLQRHQIKIKKDDQLLICYDDVFSRNSNGVGNESVMILVNPLLALPLPFIKLYDEIKCISF